MAIVTVTGHLDVPDADIELVQKYSPDHIRLTLAESGCLKFEFLQDAGNPNIFHLDEAFESREAFDLHIARAKTSKWGQVSAHLKRNFTISE